MIGKKRSKTTKANEQVERVENVPHNRFTYQTNVFYQNIIFDPFYIAYHLEGASEQTNERTYDKYLLKNELRLLNI